LDTKDHKLYGTEAILYKNNSPDTLHVFYLHLYPNAFRSKDTPLMKDIRRRFNYTFMDVPKKYRSYLDLSKVAIDGSEVIPVIKHTIARIDLPAPLAPGDSMTVTMDFEEKIRKHIGRAGYRGDHYDIAQWYPKVAVYDDKGFHADPFQTGEFYGEFGKFDVYLEVPEHYVVAATGVLEEGDPGWSLNPVDGGSSDSARGGSDAAYKTVHFVAENVHDFAWNADPEYAVQDTTWNDIHIKSFFNKDNDAWQDTTLVHGVRAAEWLSERVGLYPYPQMSIVEGLLGGGMEYPMLVMDGRVSESLVLHEIAHLYFYGILGNNERAEAWLDEGFATFQTYWYTTSRYGPHGIKRDWNWYQRLTPQYTVLGDARRRVFSLDRLGYGGRVATRAEAFKHSYRVNVYQKAALVLFALRYVVGDETFERILKQYFVTWKFKHVTGKRFQDVCEEVSGMDLEWFFEEWIYTRKICDYRLEEVNAKPNQSGDGYDVHVKIDRLGEIIMPLELEFMFGDGTVQKATLEGRLRTIKKTFQFPAKPKKTSLNKENEIIDVNMSDNFMPRRWSLQVDWPNNSYYPENAYQIRHRPWIWYNDVDGAKVGYILRGSYFSFYRRFQLGLYYGIKSERVDFTAAWAMPIRTLAHNGNLKLSGYKLEGRQDFTLKFSLRRRRELIRPPTQQISLGFNYHELTNKAYVTEPEFYQTGADVSPLVVGYKSDPQFDVLRTKTELGLRFGRKWFGGKYKYTRFFGVTEFETRRSLVPFDFGVRLFLGLISGSMPNQQKFNLAGAGILGQETVFFLRSRGAIWPDAHYLMPGDGNLRGYAEGTFPVNKLLTLNAKLGRTLPWISKPRNRWFGEVKLSAFADVGTIFDTSNPISGDPRVQALVDDGVLNETLVDAGVGLRVRRHFPFWDFYLRYDVPLYVNQPKVNGETKETQYRYLFSLTSVFEFSIN
jgi:hypothetical protein